jgi:hypothetical protein
MIDFRGLAGIFLRPNKRNRKKEKNKQQPEPKGPLVALGK